MNHNESSGVIEKYAVRMAGPAGLYSSLVGTVDYKTIMWQFAEYFGEFAIFGKLATSNLHVTINKKGFQNSSGSWLAEKKWRHVTHSESKNGSVEPTWRPKPTVGHVVMRGIKSRDFFDKKNEKKIFWQRLQNAPGGEVIETFSVRVRFDSNFRNLDTWSADQSHQVRRRTSWKSVFLGDFTAKTV